MTESRRWRASTWRSARERCSRSWGRMARARPRRWRSWKDTGAAPRGDVSVLGADPVRAGRDWRARIGVVLQESQPEAELTAEECLSLYAGYYPRPRPVAETLELVGLTDHRTVRCGRMSGGQRRRLDVALALIGDPELIFLDEPTTGIRPRGPQVSLGRHRRAAGPRQDDLPDHALHGGSRVPGRPDRGPGRRADRGRGHRGHPGRAGHRSVRRQLHPADRRARRRPAARRWPAA